MFIKPHFYAEAIANLLPEGTGFAMGGPMEWRTEFDNASGKMIQTIPTNVQLIDPNSTVKLPHRAEIEAEVIRLEKEWEDKEYQRLRKPEYPSLEVLADALYHQANGDNSKMEAYLAAVEAVKAKYPKG